MYPSLFSHTLSHTFFHSHSLTFTLIHFAHTLSLSHTLSLILFISPSLSLEYGTNHAVVLKETGLERIILKQSEVDTCSWVKGYPDRCRHITIYKLLIRFTVSVTKLPILQDCVTKESIPNHRKLSLLIPNQSSLDLIHYYLADPKWFRHVF